MGRERERDREREWKEGGRHTCQGQRGKRTWQKSPHNDVKTFQKFTGKLKTQLDRKWSHDEVLTN